jgi:hypothetical protein
VGEEAEVLLRRHTGASAKRQRETVVRFRIQWSIRAEYAGAAATVALALTDALSDVVAREGGEGPRGRRQRRRA